MLANSPHLPIIIDHNDEDNVITTEDEERIILALQHDDRVRRIRLRSPIPNLQNFIIALDGEFPILEFLLIYHSYSTSTIDAHDTNLNLPETFRAPHLCYLFLMDFSTPIESPLLTTMANLVTLELDEIPPSAYFHPNALLQRISLMPQLEALSICFSSHSPSDDVERQLLPVPTMTHVTLPNLRVFGFQGASAYLETLIPWVTFPLLEDLEVFFSNDQLPVADSIPHLQRFISTAWNLRPISTVLYFSECYLYMTAYPREGATVYSLFIAIDGSHGHLDSQIFHAIETVFSAVEHLTLQYSKPSMSAEWNNVAVRTQWRELFRISRNVRTLLVDDELVGQLSRSLQSSEGELSTVLLPELQELLYYSTDASHDAFSQFIEARKAGRPVTAINLPVNDGFTARS